MKKFKTLLEGEGELRVNEGIQEKRDSVEAIALPRGPTLDTLHSLRRSEGEKEELIAFERKVQRAEERLDERARREEAS